MIPVSTEEVLAAIVSVPVVIAISAMLNGIFKIASRYKPAVVLAVAICASGFANWVLMGDWRIAVGKGVLIGLVASGLYSSGKAASRG